MSSARAVAGDGLRLGKWKGHCVFRTTWDYKEPLDKKPWVGELREPGPEAGRLNDPNGIACDAAGNVYVADAGNDRIQVFSPEAKLIKSIKAERPLLVAVHQKKPGRLLRWRPPGLWP